MRVWNGSSVFGSSEMEKGPGKGPFLFLDNR